MEKRDEGKKRRESGKKAAAVVTSAALLLGGVFHDAQKPDGSDSDAPPPTWMEMISPDTDNGDDGDGSEEAEEEKRSGVRQRRFLRLPRGVRAFSGVGIWALGCALLSLLSAVLSGGVSPLLRTLLVWLGMAAVLFAAFVATMKGVFPDLPLKKLLKKRSLWFLLFGALTLGVLEGVLLWRFPGSGSWREWMRLLGTLGLLSGVTGAALHREHRRRKKAREKAEREAAEAAEKAWQEGEEERNRHRILALADSVSRRRG